MYEIYVSKINRNMTSAKETRVKHTFYTLEEAMEKIEKIVAEIEEKESVEQITKWPNAVEVSFNDRLHTQLLFEVIDA